MNSDGYSVSLDYLKYDTEWRRHIREFQEDLGAGRYDSQWQEDAAEAMQERACGKFDSFKEEEFEAFWGQKQKADHDARAGEGSKVKLDELLGAGVLRKGDELSFRRHFARDRGDLLVEKEMKVRCKIKCVQKLVSQVTRFLKLMGLISRWPFRLHR